jgi:hypothetical protein
MCDKLVSQLDLYEGHNRESPLIFHTPQAIKSSMNFNHSDSLWEIIQVVASNVASLNMGYNLWVASLLLQH